MTLTLPHLGHRHLWTASRVRVAPGARTAAWYGRYCDGARRRRV